MKYNTWQLLENAVLETLEDRRMMSASPMGSIALKGGTLTLNGQSSKPTQMVVDFTPDKSELAVRIGSNQQYFATNKVKTVNITGGGNSDYIYINSSLNVNAVITTGDGNDFIHAGGGNATITSGNGNDVIYGAQGGNVIKVGNGNNNVYGGPGKDFITVGSGNNNVYGGSGDDSITAGNGRNTLNGASGDDTIVAGSGSDFLNGGLGNDQLTAGKGLDSLMGYSGDDVIHGGGVGSIRYGGTGNNTVDPTLPAGGTTDGSGSGSTDSGGSGSTGTTGGTGTTTGSGTTGSGGSTGSTGGTGTTGTGGTGASGSGSGTGTTGGTGTGTGGTTTGGGTGGTTTGSGGTGTGTGGTTTGSGGTGTGTGGTTTGTGTGGTTTGSGGTTTGTGGTTTLPPTNPNAATPTPVLNLLDGTRQAGLVVNVDALSSKLAVGTPITATYEWDFGDSGTRFDTITGYNAAHVYDKAGTYTIKLTVVNEDGGAATVSKQVTIAASTRKQIFVDANAGSDNNSGSQNSPLKTLDKAFTLVGDNTEVLLRAGEKFDVTATLHINSKNVFVGSYGNGANPIINRIKGGGVSTIATFSNANGVTIEGITFDSPYGVGVNDQAPKIGVSGVYVGGTNIAVKNCTFLNLDDAVNENGYPTGVLVQDNGAPLTTGLRGYFCWAQGWQGVIVGNNVANSTREHNVRLVDMDEVNIQDNNLTNLNRQNVDSYDYSKGSIEMHRGEYAYIAYNTVTDGDIRLGPLGLHGESPTTSTDWSVIKDNTMNNSVVFLNAGTHHAMVEGNVITNNSSEVISISGVDGQGRTSSDITLINNTGIDNGTSGHFLKLGGYVNGIVMSNNIWVAPKITPGNQGASAVSINASDLSSFTTIANNIWPAEENENSTTLGYMTNAQWDKNSKVHGDVFENVQLNSTYQVTLGSLKAGSPLARAA